MTCENIFQALQKQFFQPKLFKVEHTCENGAWSVPREYFEISIFLCLKI